MGLHRFKATRPDGSVIFDAFVDDNTSLVVGKLVVRYGRLYLLSTFEGDKGSIVVPDIPIVGDICFSLSVVDAFHPDAPDVT